LKHPRELRKLHQPVLAMATYHYIRNPDGSLTKQQGLPGAVQAAPPAVQGVLPATRRVLPGAAGQPVMASVPMQTSGGYTAAPAPQGAKTSKPHTLRKQKSQEAASLSASLAPNQVLGYATFPEPLGKVQIVHLGQESQRMTIHAMTTDGCKTIDGPEEVIEKLVIKQVKTAKGRCAEAEAEAAKIDDLIYMKENVSLRRLSDGHWITSTEVSSSTGGDVDVWNGENLHMTCRDGPEIQLLGGGDYMLAIKRTTQRFPDEKLEQDFIAGKVDYTVYEEDKQKKTNVQEWHAAIEME